MKMKKVTIPIPDNTAKIFANGADTFLVVVKGLKDGHIYNIRNEYKDGVEWVAHYKQDWSERVIAPCEVGDILNLTKGKVVRWKPTCAGIDTVKLSDGFVGSMKDLMHYMLAEAEEWWNAAYPKHPFDKAWAWVITIEE